VKNYRLFPSKPNAFSGPCGGGFMIENLQIWPALGEMAYLLFLLFMVTVSIICAVRLNYTFYRSGYYLPFMVLLGLDLSRFTQVYFQWNLKTVFLVFAFPVLTALFFKYVLKGKYKSPIYFAAPAAVLIFLLFMYPLVFEVYLAFHKLNLSTLSQWVRNGDITFVGLENFKDVFTWASETQESFGSVALRTFYWTVINVFFHVMLGVTLAFLLNKKIRGIGIYRTLLVVPWALPQLISVLAWRGEFHSSFGYINQVLALLHLPTPEWWTNPQALFTSMCIVNIWLGVPFMMVIALGGLQAIPKTYYEAASIDGASRWQQLKAITLPLLKPVMLPAIIFGSILTFNNVNVVFLMTSQKGGISGADILVSDLYKRAFIFNRYSFSAAYSLVIFILLLFLTLLWAKASKVTESINK